MLKNPAIRLRRARLLMLLVALVCGSCAIAQRTPVVLDTDIGSDIDDAFAVAMIVKSKQLDLKAVTTVSGDAQARARIVAKLLTLSGMGSVPVAVGASDAKPAFAQARWAQTYTGSDLVREPAVELMKQAIEKEHGRMVILAIGPLTNIAALLKQYPAERTKIREIVLMGGSIARGYTPGSGPTPEYNIAADAVSAQAVFASGIPIRMAPLDVTARLQLDGPHRQQIFALHTAVTDALQALYQLWGQPTPTLHDPMAISLLTAPSLCEMKRMHVEIESNGMTREEQHMPPNATVAVETDPARFIDYFVSLFAHP